MPEASGLPPPLAAPPPTESVGRGAIGKLFSEAVGRALQFGATYVTQRALGPEGYGHLALAQAFGLVAAQGTDLGVQLLSTRQLARGVEDRGRLVGAGLTLRAVLASAALVVLGLLSLLRPPAVRLSFFLLGAAVVGQVAVEYLGYLFRGFHRVTADAWLLFGLRALTAACTIAAVWLGLGLPGIAVAWMGSAALTWIAGFSWLRRTRLGGRVPFDVGEAWQLARRALPLGAAITLSIAYVRTPFVVLDAAWGPRTTGQYGVAQKLTEPLTLIPAAVMAAVFPAIVGPDLSPARNRRLRRRTALGLGLLACMLAGLALALSPRLLAFLYRDQYAEAAGPLRWLGVALVPMFVNYALTHYVTAMGRERALPPINAAVFTLNLALCAWWTPRYGAVGAAAAILASELLLLVLCTLVLRRAADPADA